MKPVDWNEAALKDWREFYAVVEREVRVWANRSKLIGSRSLSTVELVEFLYPAQFARGDGITARRRIFRALAALATTGLADCASRGQAKRSMGRTVRPWEWHAPREPNDEARVIVCPHCGGLIGKGKSNG